ncbi:hypothetical protein L593_06155 [Salinarchaeum sp. Harcht-Bsk1]|uniref:DUF5810 domain-containing protein n=1 Tax=Salinarchaeum sp. Harcht-Bsk1 TaxID=1333523 RepID=UPI000342437B|nr:DUF5810 domain-containing protein [Salinarchaeum sp. Harcht-Bsk1]AGN01180.1 hypothetical protein L593_06155 [Salinarchaeum sp. Harcht-Bsk1]
MAYACPVCETLAPDGEHLAHHLAIVAMTRGGDHERWLDDHAAGWREEGPEALAATATEYAETVEHELADESAGEHPDVGHDHGQTGGAGHADRVSQIGGAEPPAADNEETAAVLAEAREITQRMLGEDEASGSEKPNGETSGNEENDDERGEGPAETDTDE